MTEGENIANHRDFCNMSVENTREIFDSLKISKICGSVIHARRVEKNWALMKEMNDVALKLRDIYGDFLVYGLSKEWYLSHPEIMEMKKSEELKYLMENGALVIHAHPYREQDI